MQVWPASAIVDAVGRSRARLPACRLLLATSTHSAWLYQHYPVSLYPLPNSRLYPEGHTHHQSVISFFCLCGAEARYMQPCELCRMKLMYTKSAASAFRPHRQASIAQLPGTHNVPPCDELHAFPHLRTCRRPCVCSGHHCQSGYGPSLDMCGLKRACSWLWASEGRACGGVQLVSRSLPAGKAPVPCAGNIRRQAEV